MTQTDKSKQLLIIGAAEPGYEAKEILESSKAGTRSVFYSFYDDFAKGEMIRNALSEDLRGLSFVCSIGNVNVRELLYTKFTGYGLYPENVISDDSWISPSATIGNGVLIYPQCSVSSFVRIEDNALLNFHCSVSHGAHIGMHSNLCPGVRIAGNVVIGKRVYVGMGSVVKERIRICDDVLIGANSLVLRDITEPGVYAGSPCVFLKPRQSA